VILVCTVLIQYSSVPDGQTDRQTPRLRLRLAKHSAVARNGEPSFYVKPHKLALTTSLLLSLITFHFKGSATKGPELHILAERQHALSCSNQIVLENCVFATLIANVGCDFDSYRIPYIRIFETAENILRTFL